MASNHQKARKIIHEPNLIRLMDRVNGSVEGISPYWDKSARRQSYRVPEILIIASIIFYIVLHTYSTPFFFYFRYMTELSYIDKSAHIFD